MVLPRGWASRTMRRSAWPRRPSTRSPNLETMHLAALASRPQQRTRRGSARQCARPGKRLWKLQSCQSRFTPLRPSTRVGPAVASLGHDEAESAFDSAPPPPQTPGNTPRPCLRRMTKLEMISCVARPFSKLFQVLLFKPPECSKAQCPDTTPP